MQVSANDAHIVAAFLFSLNNGPNGCITCSFFFSYWENKMCEGVYGTLGGGDDRQDGVWLDSSSIAKCPVTSIHRAPVPPLLGVHVQSENYY